jgi:FdhD protein
LSKDKRVKEGIKKVPILRVDGQDVNAIDDVVVREHTATITLNDREVVTLLCSPGKLEYLATGFLLSEGLVRSRDDIIATRVIGSEQKSTVQVEVKGLVKINDYISSGRLIASSGGRGFSSGTSSGTENRIKQESRIEVSDREIIALVEKFNRRSPVFAATGGVHSAALCNTEDIMVFSDDIGRHNAVDRVLGECLLKGIATSDRLIITSGRVSSEILLKIAKRNIPVIVSVAPPTDVAIELADNMAITLVGFVRGSRMNIYTHQWRITTEGIQR